MELNGLDPSRGPVVVNGATGGVASVAIDMLSTRGYAVTAVTGKKEEHDYLRRLGARDILDRLSIESSGKPLERPLWAGAVDSLGGEALAWLTRTMQPDGTIAAFGNALGAELHTTVLPFILRGVRLIGVNANSPMALREQIWRRIAGDLKPRHLATISHEIGLQQLPEAFRRLVDNRTRGRVVVAFHQAE
jgi:putative YhdH/YhfP family quinone oxidoreductase